MDILKKLRKNKGITQAELGKILGVSPSTIGMYEQGRRAPDKTSLIALARFFNVTTDYLLGNDAAPSQHAPAPSSLDQETAELAKQYQTDESTRILLEAAKGAKPQDLQKAAEYLCFLKDKE